MGHVLHRGLLQGWEPVWVGTCVKNELVEVGEFSEGDRWGFGKEVLG